MRVHVVLEDELVAELDRRVGRVNRGQFIARAVRTALDREIRAMLGTMTPRSGCAPSAGWILTPEQGRWQARL